MLRSKSSLPWIIGLVFLAAAGVIGRGSAGQGAALGDAPPDKDRIGAKSPRPEVVTFRVAIPRNVYQSIVISPATAPRGIETVPFVIRTKESEGTVGDFTFFIPVGTTQTINFPNGGWASETDSELFALDGAEFSAWGVTTGRGGGGTMVRFLPVGRDAFRDVTDREREREFETFLREQQRNK